MLTEDENDFMDLDEFATTVVYSSPDYVDSHASSKSIPVIGILMQEYVEFNGGAGLMTTFRTFKQGDAGGRFTFTDNDGNESDFYVREVQNDGSDFYRWVCEAI